MATIGIVGAAGAVGRYAAAALHRLGRHGLLRCGRRRGPLEQVAAGLPGARVAAVDLYDPTGLASFCVGCDVVLNCAGPAYEVGDRVARVAIPAGADYVDAAGDEVLLQQVARLRPVRAAATAMVSAGMMPGLTALLPRHLLRLASGTPLRLTGYVGGRDRFTVTAAADYFRGGSSFGVARMVLRGGARVLDASPMTDAWLPFFPERATAVAFLSTEVERICARRGIADASWYSVFAGERVPAVLRVSPGDGPPEPLRRAEALAQAAALDTFGRQAYQLVVLELVTTAQTKTLVLRGRGASELTGEFAALSAHAVADRLVPVGVHHAGEVVDPARTIARLRDSACVDDIAVLNGSAQEAGSYLAETV